MEKNSVAEIILDQMGGKARLVTFTGAGSFVSYKAEDQSKHGRGLGAVAFSFPNAASRPNHVRITLDWNDTYTVEFMQFNGTIDRPVVKLTEVYCDQLMDLFESKTGLFLSIASRS